jgi:hypothetical protein
MHFPSKSSLKNERRRARDEEGERRIRAERAAYQEEHAERLELLRRVRAGFDHDTAILQDALEFLLRRDED